MESLKGGVSFKVNFINSGDNPGNSSGESQRLIGIYDGDWSLGDDGTVNASMTFARRAGGVRSHSNLIEKVRGVGETEARVSISECLDIEDESVELSGWLLVDPIILCGRISFLHRVMPTKLFVPDSLENDQKLEVVRVALRVGAVALHCSGLSLEELRKSPAKHFPSGEVDELVSRFNGNVDFGREWGDIKRVVTGP
ncbi:hypothetical protein TM074_01155 [Candidatus Nanosynbacter sp. TM7-074]|uniref:Uncharacterized protein n=1 Tax=Candidatus Nanosynbacter sp. TM7-074 TaxID=3158573 RepID=A0AB39J978_9BACT